ncbi:hypothetical protein [Pseudoclavibacter sp. 8L]|uniref:hypothetical protein n=1 Tax=Pseudoclavibacter sp. 8L TaxID=2653162 RepID=UPI0012EF17E0|nr:hypothetical protein [Pseudoclavibacter sp. 8L]VXB74746.1 hypothetical protein PSCLAVI8L_180138 [Pseudoclavibacter sp. 8L]
MPEYTVNVGDFGLQSIPGLRLTVEAERSAWRGNRVAFERAVEPKAFTGSLATFDLLPNVETTPRVRYWLVGRYSNGMEVNRVEVVAPPGGGSLRAAEDAAAAIGTIVLGYGITQARRGVLAIDIKGDANGMAELVIEKGALE